MVTALNRYLAADTPQALHNSGETLRIKGRKMEEEDTTPGIGGFGVLRRKLCRCTVRAISTLYLMSSLGTLSIL